MKRTQKGNEDEPTVGGYPISDDLSVIDESLDWCLLFHHEHEIHFGTNRPRIATELGDAREWLIAAELNG